MGGTFDLVLISFGLDLVRSLSVGMVRVGGVGTCTLLGPEGPGADRASRCGWWWLVAVPLGPVLVPVFRWLGWVPPVL